MPFPTHMATTTLRVEGMTCGACTSAVETGFKNLDGAGNVSVSLVMSRAVVQHDPKILSPEAIKDIVEDRGFDAEVLSTDIPNGPGSARFDEGTDKEASLSTTTLAVEGMTCGACTSAVEGGFKAVSGVKSMSVSLLSERAVVEHDASVISPEAVAEIIEDRGFGATILETQASTVRPAKGSSVAKIGTGPDLTTTTVAIEGMTCGACTSAVEGGFKGVDGVVQFNISLLAERAVIVHDAKKLPASQIAETIEDRGFGAEILSSHIGATEPSTTSRNARLKVFGLRDAAAATTLESTLRTLPGVSAAEVNFSTSRVSITHNPTMTGLRALVENTENLGYNALLAESDDNDAQLESLAKTREIQEWKRAFLTSLFFAIPVFLISMVLPMFVPALDFGSWLLCIPGLYLGDVLAIALTVPVQFGIGKRFYISAYRSLRHGSPTMDVLVVLGTSAAFFFSCVAMLVSILFPPHSRPSTVFETSTMLITFITLGRFLENRAKGQTSKALSRLMSLTPSTATIYADPIAAEKAAESWDDAVAMVNEKMTAGEADITSHATQEKVIPSELIEVGDIVVLRPGDKIPADGTVLRGQSYVDESMVTGEAMPINKGPGSELMAGTVNGAGRVDFRVSRAGSDTQLSQIVKLVQEAQTTRAPIQRMADVVAGYFVPTIVALGLLTFTGWMILSHVLPNPPKIFDQPESGGKLMVCVKLCISVIVFACPCALGLSTPTAVMVGTGVGAEQGILVKGGAALETATKVNHVVFDKTGTLTMGKMEVAETRLEQLWDANEWRRRLWWSLVGLAEMGTEHPIGKAILQAAKTELGISSDGMIDGSVGEFIATVGKGISASVEPASSVERKRYTVHVGNASYLSSQGITLPSSVTAIPTRTSKIAPKSGTTKIYTAIDGIYAGALSLSDTLKPSARAAILALHRMHISTSLVTGDQLPTALAVASAIGIPESNIHAGVLPDQKQSIIKQLQAQQIGNRPTIVAMVGDGINDSPALATADIGIALASGTDVAMEAADIVLMRPDDLLSVPASLSLSRSIFNRIKLNLGWACLYNFIGLPFAMGFGLVLPKPVMLPPMAAGAAMAASSTSVVCSSLLLKFWRRPGWMTVEKLERQREGLKGMRATYHRGLADRVGRVVGGVIGRRRRRTLDEGYVPLQDVEAV
jgi:Cu+-exporting ATPase